MSDAPARTGEAALPPVPDDGEIVDGRPLPRRRTVASVYLAGRVASVLHAAYADAPPPWLFGGGVAYRCFRREPGRVRRVDVSAVAGAAPWAAGDAECLTAPPALAVQVVSIRDRAAETIRRIEDFLEAGAEAFWLVGPARRVVTDYRRPGPRTYRIGDRIPLPTAGPRLPVADLFPAAGDGANRD